MAKRGIVSVHIILSYGEERGMTTHQMLKNTGITQTQLSNPDSHIEDHQELQVLNNLLIHLGDGFRIGVELGLRYQLTSYGIVGYALLASSSLRKAAEVGFRYLSLTYAFSKIQLVESSGLVQLELPVTFQMNWGNWY